MYEKTAYHISTIPPNEYNSRNADRQQIHTSLDILGRNRTVLQPAVLHTRWFLSEPFCMTAGTAGEDEDKWLTNSTHIQEKTSCIAGNATICV